MRTFGWEGVWLNHVQRDTPCTKSLVAYSHRWIQPSSSDQINAHGTAAQQQTPAAVIAIVQAEGEVGALRPFAVRARPSVASVVGF